MSLFNGSAIIINQHLFGSGLVQYGQPAALDLLAAGLATSLDGAGLIQALSKAVEDRYGGRQPVDVRGGPPAKTGGSR